MKSYDVAVIGSGPGGYVAAIRCAQLGMKTALIEKYSTLGGTCLNVGCIPSKALLDSSHHYHDAVKHFEEHGIEVPGEVKINLEKMIARKQSVVDQTTSGINYLMDKNKIDVFHGLGQFKDATHISIKGDKDEEIEAKYTIIATGSKPSNLPFINNLTLPLVKFASKVTMIFVGVSPSHITLEEEVRVTALSESQYNCTKTVLSVDIFTKILSELAIKELVCDKVPSNSASGIICILTENSSVTASPVVANGSAEPVPISTAEVPAVVNFSALPDKPSTE